LGWGFVILGDMIIDKHVRLQAACRRLKFELAKLFGVFWLIEITPFLKIKEPWNKLYKRSLITQIKKTVK